MEKKLEPKDVITGNYFNKYQSKFFLYQYVTNNFCKTLEELFHSFNDIESVHEVGCGEGHLLDILNKKNVKMYASDISHHCIEQAKNKAMLLKYEVNFKVSSIYDLKSDVDKANLVVCCEVLEHLENPNKAIEVLASIADPYLIISVPREPLWSILNMARGKYWKSLGNTPGHLQRWSSNQIVNLLSKHFEILEIRQPIPWTFISCKRK